MNAKIFCRMMLVLLLIVTAVPFSGILAQEDEGFVEPDFSWLMDEPVDTVTVGAANCRRASVLDSGLMTVIEAGSEVRVLASTIDDDGATRILVQGPIFTCWVNNADALIDLTNIVDEPFVWLGEGQAKIGADRVDERCQEIGEMPAMNENLFYSPEGDPVTDLRFFPGNIVGKGVLAEGEDHVIAVLRLDGEFNPVLTRHGLWQRAQGTAWACDSRWLLMEEPLGELYEIVGDSDHHPSIGWDFATQDAADFANVNFNPPIFLVDVTGYSVELDRDWILDSSANAQIDLITAHAQENCRNEVVEITPTGRRDGLEMRVGELGIPNVVCYTVVVHLSEDTPDDTVQVTAWQGARHGFEYIQGSARAFYFPLAYDNEMFTTWLQENLYQIILEMELQLRPNVEISGLTAFSEGEILPLTTFAPE